MAQKGYALAAQRPSFEDEDDAEKVPAVPANGQRDSRSLQPRKHSWMVSRIWFVSTVILVFVVIGQTFYKPSSCPADSYAIGHANEFDEVKPTIRTEQRRFTSAIRHYANGSLFTAWDPNEPRYTTSGASYQDVDKAWNDLLEGRYIRLKDSEVEWINSDALQQLTPITNLSWVEPGTYGGPDMLHSLHCLNGLRKHLDYDHYKDEITIPEEYRIMHIDHCIDQLRQAVLCHGDMTPVTLKPVTRPDGHVWALLGETEYSHTCRNGHELREWWWRRGDQTGRLDSS